MKKIFLLMVLCFLWVLSCVAKTEKPVRTPQEERASWYQILHWPAIYEDTYQAVGLKSHSGLSFYALSDTICLTYFDIIDV